MCQFSMHQKGKDKIPGKKTVSYGLKSLRYFRSETLEANPRWVEKFKSLKWKVWHLRTALANYVQNVYGVRHIG